MISNTLQNRFHIEDIRVLNAISVELYLSLLTVVYSIVQGIVFQKLVNAVLFAIIGFTQLRLFWFLYTGWRYRSFYLLLTPSLFNFKKKEINYFQPHVLVALCSLVPFIIGFNASWRFYCKMKN
ncbi:Eukaryotic translation initiation factor 3 subunit [Dirofilaria immitis]